MATKIYRKRDLPISIPLICRRGATLRSPLYRHRDPVTQALLDLTGCILAVPATLADGTALDLAPYLVTDLPGGRYRIIIPVSVTEAATPWPAGLGNYDIYLTDSLGVTTCYFGGVLGLKEAAE
jgi:hypothetical protein